MKAAVLCFLIPIALASAVTPPAEIKVPANFRVELLREAGERDGSWIAMTQDNAGRLYISPQGAIPESGFSKQSKWGGIIRATVAEYNDQLARKGEKGPSAGISKWEKVPVPVGDAMGMLWAFDSLYISGQGPEGRGIYRCKDTDGDSLPDSAILWKSIPGGAGEHGAHALRLGPDGKSIYIIHGNSTPLVDGVDADSPYRNWGEDDLIPRVKDPVATFFDKLKAPYGCLYRTDEDGNTWKLLAGGMRNAYDIDFNADGELFTYDSDMEWDRGLPWYRPTRVLHLVPGGEYGFREGSAKMPDYLPDVLPPVCDIGVGCPTGVAFGTRAKFPEKYQRAFFICDWTYGRILAVHMKEKGSGFTASNPLKSYTFPKDAEASDDVETFLSGKALPITDIEIGKDGAMYMTTGGRGTAAALYRVSYDANDAGSQIPGRTSATPNEARVRAAARKAREVREELFFNNPADTPEGSKLRNEITQKLLQETGDDPKLRKEILTDSNLGFQKLRTFIRLAITSPNGAAESAIERAKLSDPLSFPEANLVPLLGMAHSGIPKFQETIFDILKSMPLAKLSDDNKLMKLRIINVCLARMGRPSEEWQKTGLEKLLASYPATGTSAQRLNRELCQLLIWLSQPELGAMNADLKPVERKISDLAPDPGAETVAGRKGQAFHAELGRQVIEKTLVLMDAAASQEEQIEYALNLRWAHGWTPQQREHYLRWFHEKAARYTGGNSFRKFIEKIHSEAAGRVPEAERAGLEKWLAPMSSPVAAAPVKQRAFVKNWTLAELEPELDALKDRKPDAARGAALFAEAQCARCHLFRDSGGNAGPDLSAVAQRFGRKDILEACIDPNKVVSDQYALTTLTVIKFGGGQEDVTGLVQEESSGVIRVLTDPLAGTAREFYHNVVKKKEKAAISLMPPALLNTLTAEEVADLLAFLGTK